MDQQSLQEGPGDLTKKKQNLRPYLIGGLLVLFGLTVALVVYTGYQAREPGGGDSSNSAFPVLFTIWIAAIVPILHKNEEDNSPESVNKRMFISLILGGLVVAGGVLFLLLNR